MTEPVDKLRKMYVNQVLNNDKSNSSFESDSNNAD